MKDNTPGHPETFRCGNEPLLARSPRMQQAWDDDVINRNYYPPDTEAEDDAAEEEERRQAEEDEITRLGGIP